MWPGKNGEQIAENPDNGANSAETNRLAEEGAMLLARQPQKRQPIEPIGMATMSADGTITLELHTHEGAVGDAHIRYKPNDKEYGQISEHIGGIKPGQVKTVQPWSDQIRRQDMNTPPESSGETPNSSGEAPEKPPAAAVAPTSDFSQKVTDTYNALPQNVRDALAKDGVKVVATDKVTDVMPELAGKKPRGWPPGSSWEDVDGAYDTTGKRIIVAQKQNNPKRSTNDVAGLTRHETGHAVDRLHNFSAKTIFETAYDREVANVPKPDAQTLDYFLQKGDGGKEETFAETFAIIHGGATSTAREFLLKKNFPDTIKVVSDQTKGL